MQVRTHQITSAGYERNSADETIDSIEEDDLEIGNDYCKKIHG
jgi:hypothetical protein